MFQIQIVVNPNQKFKHKEVFLQTVNQQIHVEQINFYLGISHFQNLCTDQTWAVEHCPLFNMFDSVNRVVRIGPMNLFGKKLSIGSKELYKQC